MESPESRISKNRPAANRRRGQIFILAGVACAAIVLWISFEMGQIRAGHNVFESSRKYSEAQSALKQERKTVEELRREIALLETSKKIDDAAYQQVEAELTDLQTEILAQQEDLAFYRGIVSDQETGLRVQGLELVPGTAPDEYSLRLVLAQAIRADRRISGSVQIKIEGVKDETPQTLSLKEVGGDAARLAFAFRYFQNVDTDLSLPVGFAPGRVIVTLTPKGKTAKVVEKAFEWAVGPG